MDSQEINNSEDTPAYDRFSLAQIGEQIVRFLSRIGRPIDVATVLSTMADELNLPEAQISQALEFERIFGRLLVSGEGDAQLVVLSTIGAGQTTRTATVETDRPSRLTYTLVQPLPVSPAFPAVVPEYLGFEQRDTNALISWEPGDMTIYPLAIRGIFTEIMVIPGRVSVTASYQLPAADSIELCYRALSASARDRESMVFAQEQAERASYSVRELSPGGGSSRIHHSDALTVDLARRGDVAIVTGTSIDPRGSRSSETMPVPPMTGWTEIPIAADVRPAF